MRLPVAEIPTIWLDRQAGVSNFQLAKWLPGYLRWYRFAYGRRLALGSNGDRSTDLGLERDRT
jgi:dolichol-phosphate mannosyltransferase